MKQEKIYFWGFKKAKISLQGTKMDFGAQNQYGRVILLLLLLLLLYSY
jgi:hypothetical protein